MPIKRTTLIEKRARALCAKLARVTGGRPVQWRTVGPIGRAVGLDDASEAIAYAVDRDWLRTEGQPRIASASRMMAASWPPR
jgi:hypothetical protein